MTEHLVVFQPLGKRGRIQQGKSVLEAARELGVEVESICGGRESCGKCKIRVEEGFFASLGIHSGKQCLSPPSDKELELLGESAIADGYRLACAASICGDLLVFVPEDSLASKHIIAKTTTQRDIQLKLAVRKCYVELTPPSLKDPRADWERLAQELAERFGLKKLDIDHQALISLSDILHRSHWKVTATILKDRELIKVEPGLVEASFGLAIDLGSTSLAGYLCDLKTGQIIATEAVLNPQIAYGEDVVSRIVYAGESPAGLAQLNTALIDALNKMIVSLADKARITNSHIDDVTVVGNTVMHHLFLNLNPRHLGRSPFAPVLQSPVDIKARELGLEIDPSVNVHMLPVEAGFVGADNVAVIIAEEPYNEDGMGLIVDIGTNGELILGNRQHIISASCATGPTFEGAHIKFGMRASTGAIESISIDPESYEVAFKVIGSDSWSTQQPDIKARGICGSGMIDAAAEMLNAGIINPRGAFNKGISTPRLLGKGAEPEFVIAWPNETSLDHEISVSQGDIRAIQLAKGSLLAGAKVMMNKLGITQVDKLVLTGAFGLHIDKAKAMAIGILPDCDLNKVHSVSNAAGEGARLALLNTDKRQEAAEIARRVEYVELSLDPAFSEEFVKAMYFGNRQS